MLIGSKILHFKKVSSTNTVASRLAKYREVPEGSVVTADFQTGGKGRSGNKWFSEKGRNLLLSIILYPRHISPGDQFFISMTISLGIIDFIDRYTGGGKIKWPNDIYVGDKKIAGILIENSLMGDKMEFSIAGIGININQEVFPPELPEAVSLRMVTGEKTDTRECLNQLLSCIDKRYNQLTLGERPIIRDLYISRLYCFMNSCSFIELENGRVFAGRISDVMPSGLIIIEEDNNKRRGYSFNEIKFCPRVQV
jgi:BirA family biotin operon repressor/biotin-[acetyl-CoA-carboxylase] ligase